MQHRDEEHRCYDLTEDERQVSPLQLFWRDAPQAGLQAGDVAVAVVVDELAEDGTRDALDAVRRRHWEGLRTGQTSC